MKPLRNTRRRFLEFYNVDEIFFLEVKIAFIENYRDTNQTHD